MTSANVQSIAFRVGDLPASARLYPATGKTDRRAGAAIVLAHGAGAPQSHPWLVSMANHLAARGLDAVTFNFPYAEAGRRLPDRSAVLEASWRAALATVRQHKDLATSRLFIGGKSMGGRLATMVAAAGDAGDIAGLVLLGYPLHPPGKPDKLRAAHLPQVTAPMLFVQGSRDAFGNPGELAPIVASLAGRGTRVFVVEGGDHSFAVPKKTGMDRDGILARVADEIARFTG